MRPHPFGRRPPDRVGSRAAARATASAVEQTAPAAPGRSVHPVRRRPLSLVLRPTPPPFGVGLLVAAAFVAVETLLAYPLKQVAPATSLGVVYLLGVLVVSTRGGVARRGHVRRERAGVQLLPHPADRAVHDRRRPRTGSRSVVFLAVALLASSVAELAASRAARGRGAPRARPTSRPRWRGCCWRRRPARGAAAAAASGWPRRSSCRRPRSSSSVARRRAARRVPAARRPTPLGTLLVPARHARGRLRRLQRAGRPGARGAAGGGARARGAARRGRRDRGAAPQRRGQDRAAARGLARPALAADRDRRRRRGARLADARRGGARRARRRHHRARRARLSRLVDKLLDLSRLEAGAAEPRRDWVSVEELIRSGDRGARPAAEATFALALDRDLPLVRADAAQLERAFANVLENAVALRRRAPGVGPRARAVGAAADRARRRPRARDPAGRAASGSSSRSTAPGDARRHRGSGLGLAIARGFVEANGGRVRVESLPGQGATFVVELPLEPSGPRTRRRRDAAG